MQYHEIEMLIQGQATKNAVKMASNLHSKFILTAEELASKLRLKQITPAQYDAEINILNTAYKRAKIFGNAGRVITVIGVVITAKELAEAGHQSYIQNSPKPLARETIRQSGSWGGAIAGAEIGFEIGAWLGAPAGPLLLVSGAIGAMFFGALGYAGADWWVNLIDNNSIKELRKDVNYAEGLKYRIITLPVGTTESQYDFHRQALIAAAIQVQKVTYQTVDSKLPERFADKFAPVRAANIKDDYEFGWVKDADGKNPQDDKDNNGFINKDTEWKNIQGRSFTYRLGENEVNELIKMVFGLAR